MIKLRSFMLSLATSRPWKIFWKWQMQRKGLGWRARAGLLPYGSRLSSGRTFRKWRLEVPRRRGKRRGREWMKKKKKKIVWILTLLCKIIKIKMFCFSRTLFNLLINLHFSSPLLIKSLDWAHGFVWSIRVFWSIGKIWKAFDKNGDEKWYFKPKLAQEKEKLDTVYTQNSKSSKLFFWGSKLIEWQNIHILTS